MLGNAGAAASAPPGCRRAPPLSDGDFTSLLERARSAHHVEVEDLKLEVLGLRQELLAVRGQLVLQPPVGASSNSSEDGPKRRRPDPILEAEACDIPAGNETHSRRMTQCSEVSEAVSSSWACTPNSCGSTGSKSGKRVGLGHAQFRRQRSRNRLIGEKGRLWAFVTSSAFEVTMAVVILANTFVLALDAQYKSFSMAISTGHASAAGESAVVWPHAEDAFVVFSWMFGVIFALELVLKIGGLRLGYFMTAWNWLDFFVVLLWACSVSTEMGMNASFIRVLRVAKLVRLARVLKLMKSHRSDGLFMMATALTGSVSATTWCFIFLMVVHVLLALGMNQFLYEAYFDVNSSDAHDQEAMFVYFGSFSRAFLTMLEITWGNFVVPVRILTEHVNEAFILYAMIHKILVGFAVLGVLNALFVQETFKAASMDDNLMVRQQRARQNHHKKRMGQLFDEADADGDGSLDMDEWMTVCQDEWVQTWLAAQDLKAEDAQSLFALIDDGDGRLTADEIVKGTSSLRGASGLMMIMAIAHRVEGCVKDIRTELLFSQPPVRSEHIKVSAALDE